MSSCVAAELEFVQIVIIIVVMTVMVVVVVCLLNHYKLTTWSFLSRASQAQSQDLSLQPEGSLWPSDNGLRQGASERLDGRLRGQTLRVYLRKLPPISLKLANVVYAPQPRDRFTAPTFMQHNRFRRFQPTYPYLQHEIDLPPTISLSDGEEPPPYQGPCTLQLRDPEQQLELNRESVRAPPNRTIFDSDLIDMHSSGGGGGPRPPSSNSGISAASSSTHGRMEGPPPAYSQVIGQQSGIVLYLHQHSNNPPIPVTVQTPPRGRTDSNSPESTIALSKDRQREELV
ncbi:Low-density lipoprotein receptor class A domain-containing protein 4 [Labeo rohita]|uniref:Low-density lipoprotein receptor class A domain-containing protein 4 n=1 Tax=Labeo rohita TaxID=84645 RepID=A0ABQ8LYU0_LABRO|nr:Low-density lipoprotein receptor class A domain-containing protein 4 [Labeo rohita]